MAIRRYSPAREYLSDERCFINELSNTDDDPDVSIARARVEPGVSTAWHRLAGVVERYVILDGSGQVETGRDAAEDVGPGDVVVIPDGVRQRITNTGPDDLVFLCICTPRFEPSSYEPVDP